MQWFLNLGSKSVEAVEGLKLGPFLEWEQFDSGGIFNLLYTKNPKLVL